MPSIKAFSVFLLFISTIKCIASMATNPVGPGVQRCSVVGPSYSNYSYVVSTLAVTWTEAFVLCKQNGMDLVSIKTAEEHDAITQALSSYSTKLYCYSSSELYIEFLGAEGVANGYWVSARRFNGDFFVWFTSGKPLVYTNFAEGQPDNAGNGEDCVEYFMLSENSYKWNDIKCDHKAGYICQVRDVYC